MILARWTRTLTLENRARRTPADGVMPFDRAIVVSGSHRDDSRSLIIKNAPAPDGGFGGVDAPLGEVVVLIGKRQVGPCPILAVTFQQPPLIVILEILFPLTDTRITHTRQFRHGCEVAPFVKGQAPFPGTRTLFGDSRTQLVEDDVADPGLRGAGIWNEFPIQDDLAVQRALQPRRNAIGQGVVRLLNDLTVAGDGDVLQGVVGCGLVIDDPGPSCPRAPCSWGTNASKKLLSSSPWARSYPASILLCYRLERPLCGERSHAFREQIVLGRVDAGNLALLRLLGNELYQVLMEPAARLIAGADSLLICSDGPLHALPSGALARRGDDGAMTWLIQEKALAFAISASVYAALKNNATPREPFDRATLVAFGDPSYPEGDAGKPLWQSSSMRDRNMSPELRNAVRAGFRFQPLPESRTEVQTIARLFGERATVYLGASARESRAKAVGGEPDFIHFACHGFLDEAFPMSSGLALALPEDGSENGLLQGWEIVEQMKIRADLVVLSACETGLGKEMGGEGLLGLTRAFQFAGADAVLATLWPVSGHTTARLMSAFYGAVGEDKPLAAALRKAQIALIKETPGSSNASHPFYWAGFLLNGDFD